MPPSPPLLRQLAARLRGRFRRSAPPVAGNGAATPPQDPLQTAGRLLREARESRGLGLRDLARETRISTTVLEALEKGWRDRLPEGAYLRTMLPLLEHYLQLPGGSLDGALPPLRSRAAARPGARGRQRIPPGLIDALGTWQGSLLYAVLTLGLIHLLNLQQQRLAAAGLLSSRPVPPLSADAPAPEPKRGDVLRAFPELRPLKQAASGQALRRLRQESAGAAAPDLSLGTLQLTLGSATELRLESGSGPATELEGLQGRLSLPVLPPFRLSLQPGEAAREAQVLWRGRPLPAAADGSWRYPPAKESPRAKRAAIAP